MTKLFEKWFEDDGKVVHQRCFDPNPALDEVKRVADAGAHIFGESEEIGRIPGWLVTQWLQEAGVKWDDPAADDVIERKLMSGDYALFRPNPERRF